MVPSTSDSSRRSARAADGANGADGGGRPRALVVGAGSAGLAAAWALGRAGFDAKLFERGARAGGRIAGERIDGFWIDRSLPLLSTGDRRLVRWIGALGLRDACLPLRPLEIVQAGTRRGEVRAVHPWRVGGIARIPGVRPLDALRASRLPRLLRRYRGALDPERPERAARWDDRSAGDFARLYFGRSGFERWVAPAVAAVHADDPDETSRVAFLLHALESEGALLGVPRSGLGEIAEGAARALDVETQTEVVALEPLSGERGEGRGGLRVVVRGPRAERTEEADVLVVATGPDTAASLTAPLLTAAERDFLAAVETLPTALLQLALERPESVRPRLVRIPRTDSPHRQGSALAAMLLEPGGGGARAPLGCGLLTGLATAAFARSHAAAPDDAVEKSLVESAERLLPGLGGRVRFARLERAAAGGVRFGVGSYRRLARFRRVAADLRATGRRLYFAGDWLAGPRLEHVVVSAERAAEDARSDLGLPSL